MSLQRLSKILGRRLVSEESPTENINPNSSEAASFLEQTMTDQIEYTYVDEKATENVLCDICIRPFIDPVEHTDCGNEFCNNCVATLKTCPKCRGPLRTRPDNDKNLGINLRPVTSKRLLNSLNELLVVCPICKGHTARGELQNHISKCPIDCDLGCGMKVAPKDKASHEFNCSSKKINCIAADIMCPWNGPKKRI